MTAVADSVNRDWTWSDRFIPEIRRIIGPFLLTTAPLEVDRNQATDLMVLNASNVAIACRVRRSRYATFRNEFTLRLGRRSGASTEYKKIIEGWADWLFVGFAHEDGSARLLHWNLIDLKAFRSHLITNPKVIKTGVSTTDDGTDFCWFDITSFPPLPSILVASSKLTVQPKPKENI